MEAAAELPRYRSHKEVHALKIARLEPKPSEHAGNYLCHTWILTPVEHGYAPLEVSDVWVQRQIEAVELSRRLDRAAVLDDLVGGYYVLYPDGYVSWSPAQAFEDGYARIN